MATLPELVSALAEIDGRDRSTIEHVARVVREAGYIPTGKRGGGAAQMDFSAAANLLLGLNGADAPKDAPAAIALLRAMQPRREATETGVAILDHIAAAETFGEAFEQFLAGAGELFQAAEKLHIEAYAERDFFRGMKMGLSSLYFVMEIGRSWARLALESPGLMQKVQWSEQYRADPFAPGFARAAGYDRRVITRLGAQTLVKVYEVVTGEIIQPSLDIEGKGATLGEILGGGLKGAGDGADE